MSIGTFTRGLAALTSLHDVTVEDLQAFRRIAYDRRLRAGTFLARAGQNSAGAWLLVGGEVELLTEAGEYGLSVDQLTAGRWVNPACAIDGGPAGWTAIATTEVQAWLLTPDTYQRLIAENGLLARRLVRMMARAVVDDGDLAGRVAARVQRAVPANGRPVQRDDLLRVGFARMVFAEAAI